MHGHSNIKWVIASSCPSLRPFVLSHGTVQLPLDWFSSNTKCSSVFQESVERFQISLKPHKNRGEGVLHMKKPARTFIILSRSFLLKIWRVLDKSFTENQNTPLMFYNFFPSLTFREERRLRVFENRVFRRVFGPKREEVTGEWWKLHNEELSDLYPLPNIVRVVKSRRMRWAGHVAHMGEARGVHRVLVGKPEGKRPLGRPRRRWGIILRWIFRKWEGVARTGWSWLRIGTGGGHLWVRWWTFGFQKFGEFVD